MKAEAKKHKKKAEPCCFEQITFFVSPSPQDPAKRAQFRVALIVGGMQPRERARVNRPSGGRGTRPAAREREKRTSRAGDR